MRNDTPVTLAVATYPNRVLAVADFDRVMAAKTDGDFDHVAAAVITKDLDGNVEVVSEGHWKLFEPQPANASTGLTANATQ